MEKSFTYRLCLMMINHGRTDGLQDKMDTFRLFNRLTEDEYQELTKMLNPDVAKTEEPVPAK